MIANFFINLETRKTKVGSFSGNFADKYELNGLTLECYRPYHKWRITYSGYLVNESGSNVKREQFVKFNFL